MPEQLDFLEQLASDVETLKERQRTTNELLAGVEEGLKDLNDTLRLFSDHYAQVHELWRAES